LSALVLRDQPNRVVVSEGVVRVLGKAILTSAPGAVTHVKQFGAMGKGVIDETVALQAAMNSGCGDLYVPKGIYKVTQTLVVPTGLRLYGAGRASVIAGLGIAGPVMQLNDNYGLGGASVEHLAISGTATTALEVKTMTGVAVRDVHLISGAFTNGFVFQQTYGSVFERLRTNGPIITGKCFSFGQAFNSNTVSTLYTSNSGAAYNFYLATASEQPAGNTFNGLAAQGGVIGLFVGNTFSNVFNGFYTENVIRPLVLGGYPTDGLARDIVFNGAILGGALGKPAGRAVVIDIGYADAVEFLGCTISGSNGFVAAAPITFTGGGGSGAQAIAFVSPDGALVAIKVLNGGSGYTSNPNVVIGGAGVGAAGSAVRSGNAVASVMVTSPGSGYQVDGMPPIRLDWSVSGRIRFSGCSIGSYDVGGGVYSQALWPLVTYKATSPGVWGVTIDNDAMVPVSNVAQSWSPARMEKVARAGYNYDHWVSWRGSDGTPAGMMYTPPVYP